MKKLGLNKKQAEEGDTLFAHTCRLNVGYVGKMSDIGNGLIQIQNSNCLKE